MKKVLIVFFYFCVLVAMQACHDKAKKEIRTENILAKDEIIKTDKDFSEMSSKVGMKKAFLEFIDDDGILLRPKHAPIVGADAIEYLSQSNDTSYTLTWEPLGAHVASSADLGFTYGTYSLALKDTTLAGTYVSIWKKQANGKWKFILDSGNEGINGDAAQ